MAELERFGVSMERELLGRFDELIGEREYASRSEAIRDLVRKELVSEMWSDPRADVIATVSIVYGHHEHHLADTLADLQHRHHRAIVSSTHVHLDPHNCLEVVIIRGRSRQVRRIADALVATRGVKHGGVVATTTGALLP
ncbi:MAG TPA: nickel-responsive transcriptional regulator NikR [Thermoanaerobaculaceae bacterium]|nr:nickel-responsive transcriptional regulator NikR [Thermoanaerobaculaceae bacterium]